MADFTPNYWNYQTNNIKTSYKKFVDLFCIIFKLELDQDRGLCQVSACFYRTVWRISNGKSGTFRLSSFRRFVNSPWSTELFCVSYE